MSQTATTFTIQNQNGQLFVDLWGYGYAGPVAAGDIKAWTIDAAVDRMSEVLEEHNPAIGLLVATARGGIDPTAAIALAVIAADTDPDGLFIEAWKDEWNAGAPR